MVDKALQHVMVKFVADASQYMSVIDATEKKTVRMASNIQKNLQKMSIAFSALGAFRFGQRVITEFSKFDEEMTKAGAVLDTHTLMQQRLRQTALDLAGEVSQAPAELARAFYDLGQAGKSANQAVQTLPIYTKFATAGSMQLSDAVRLLTDVQYAMGLSAETAAADVENLTRISDVLSKAAIKSKAEIKDFAEALSNTSAGTLRVFNKDLEAGVALLAVYADQGKRGAVAGTALTRVMLLLTAAVVKHKAAFKAKGINIFDEKGNLKSFSAIIKNFDAVINALPVEAKGGLMQQLGIKTLSQNVLLPLLGTADAIQEYDDALRKAKGTTQEMNDKILKSFANQLRMVWNLFTVLSIEIGERLAPGIDYIKSVIQEVVKIWKSFNEETKTWIAYGLAAVVILSVVGTGLALLGMILPGLLATGSGLFMVFMKIAGPVLHILHLSVLWKALSGVVLFAVRAILYTFVTLINPVNLFLLLLNSIHGVIGLIFGLITLSFSPWATLLFTILKIAAVIAVLAVDSGGMVNLWNNAKKAVINFWNATEVVRKALYSFFMAIWEVGSAAFIEIGHHAMHSFNDILEWLGLTEINWTRVFTTIRDVTVTSILAMEFGVRNFGKVWEVTWLYAKLQFVAVATRVQFFFQKTLPALGSWMLKVFIGIFTEMYRLANETFTQTAANMARVFPAAYKLMLRNFFSMLLAKQKASKETQTSISVSWLKSWGAVQLKMIELARMGFRNTVSVAAREWGKGFYQNIVSFRKFLGDILGSYKAFYDNYMALLTGKKKLTDILPPISIKPPDKKEAGKEAKELKGKNEEEAKKLKEELDKIWKPLDLKINMEKFKLKLPQFKVTELEKKLRKEFEEKAAKLGESFEEFRKRKMAEFSIETGLPDFHDEDEVKDAAKQLGENAGEEFNKGMKNKIQPIDSALFFSAEGLSRIREFMEQAQNIREGRAATADKTVQGRDAALKDTPEAIDRENENLQVLKDIRDGINGLNKKKPEIALDFGALTGGF